MIIHYIRMIDGLSTTTLKIYRVVYSWTDSAHSSFSFHLSSPTFPPKVTFDDVDMPLI
jgi:hypothetical protein